MQTSAPEFERFASVLPAVRGMHRTLRKAGEGYSYLDRRDGALILHEWSGEVVLDGRGHSVPSGGMLWIPKGVHRVFLPRSPGMHRVVNFDSEKSRRSVVIVLGSDFARACLLFDEGLAHQGVWPLRRDLSAWQLLWLGVDGLRRGDPSTVRSRLVAEGLKRIEWGLSGELRMSRLAAELGVSVAHFSRIFRREVGVTPIAYLRARRLALAKILLQTTNQSVREIGATCGIPDPQAFNKAARREWGTPPSGLRTARGG